MSSITPRTFIKYPDNSASPVAVVRCSRERSAEGCRNTFTVNVAPFETEAAARRRALAAALAGAWVRRGLAVWCPSCARKLLVSP